MGASGWALKDSRAGNEVIVNSGATLASQYSHQFGFAGTLANNIVNSGGAFNCYPGHLIGRLALNGNAVVSSAESGLMLPGGLVSYTGSGSQASTVAPSLQLQDCTRQRGESHGQRHRHQPRRRLDGQRCPLRAGRGHP
jgi:hypothetical protein